MNTFRRRWGYRIIPSRVVRSTLRQTVIRKDKQLRAELTQAMSDIGQDLKAKHLQVVSSWQHKPRFVIGYSITPTLIRVQVLPDGRNAKIWEYVDQGTPPHDIFPRVKGGRLAFRTGYEARTAPIAKFNQGSGRASGPLVRLKPDEGVHHPGTKARLFSETIEKDYRPEFVRRIENAFRRALR